MTRNQKPSPRGKRLAFETLEARELLSLNPVLPGADFDRAEVRAAAIYAAIESDPTIRFTLDDSVEASNVLADPVALKQPVVNYYKAWPTSVDLGWGVIDGAQGYEVLYRKSTAKKFTSCGVTDVNSMTINDLMPGATYYFMIVSRGDGVMTLDSMTEWSSEIRTPQYQKLSTPKITSVTSATRTISVSWTETPDVGYYEVAYRKSSEKTFTVWQNIDAGNAAAVIEALDPGASYVVKVTAKGDPRLQLDSAASTKTVKTVAIPKLAQPTITSATSDLREITFLWKDDPKATGYLISYRKSSEKEFFTTSVAAGNSQYIISGLEPNTSYQIKVVALADGETALNSADTKSKTVKTKALAKLATPTITGYGFYKRTIYVQWVDDPGATGYLVEWRAAKEKTWHTEIAPASENFRFIDHLEPNTSYVVRITALGDQYATLDSAVSKTKTIKTQALTVLPQPKLLDCGAASERAVFVGWDTVEDAMGYVVTYRNANTKTTTTEYVDPTETRHVIRCEPGTKFTITVAALGDNYETKDSAPTKAVTVATPALTKLPTPVILSTQSSDSAITVNWQRVSYAYDYVVTYKRVGSKETLTATGSTPVGIDKRSITITRLVQGAKYVVSVVAIPDPYYYLESSPATVTVATSKAQKALAPTVEMISTNSLDLNNITVEIEWRPVENAREYEVVFGQIGVGEKRYFYTSGTETSVSFNVPYKAKYYCKFRAIGVEGYLDSDYSELIPFWV